MNETPVDPTELASSAAHAATTDAVAPAVANAGDSPAKPYRVPLRIEVIDRTYAAILAAKTPAQRAAMIQDCHTSARVFLIAGERYRHPDWSDFKIQETVKMRMIYGAN